MKSPDHLSNLDGPRASSSGAKNCQTRLSSSETWMRTPTWKLIADARASVADPSDSEAVATAAKTLLTALPPAEIVATQQVLWDLMAESYRNPLWAAAYLINGGCSDDGFDYFRGWLLTQGRDGLHRCHRLPRLAQHTYRPSRRPRQSGTEFECEDALSIAWERPRTKATGMRAASRTPSGSATPSSTRTGTSSLDEGDETEMARRLCPACRPFTRPEAVLEVDRRDRDGSSVRALARARQSDPSGRLEIEGSSTWTTARRRCAAAYRACPRCSCTDRRPATSTPNAT